jgi:aldose 1-epimerase
MKIQSWGLFVLAMTLVFGLENAAFTAGKSVVEGKQGMSIVKERFGQTPDDKQADLYSLTNANGLKAKVTNFGAILVSMEVPDKNGNLTDVTLGYDTLDRYIKRSNFFGATVGRYANRIGGARFVLNGTEYKLTANSGSNHIHGGTKGFNAVVWDAKEIKTENSVGVTMSYLSKDSEEGYPGNLKCTVMYAITNNNELIINYEAETDKTTIVNLTNHSYWNLAGQGNGDVLGHELMIDADKYTVFDKGLIPTGEIRSVKGTPLDFTQPMTIGSRIAEAGGYDHNYVLNSGGGKLALCARVYEPNSGRVMEVYTTEPGVQLYTANSFNGSLTGKAGKAYIKHAGFCLETQHFPDSPNKPNFPSVVLEPGKVYTSTTAHRFFIK